MPRELEEVTVESVSACFLYTEYTHTNTKTQKDHDICLDIFDFLAKDMLKYTAFFFYDFV
jgi:hypothetical protein